MARYTVEYEHDEAGWWVARVRGVRGCITQGRTIAQARRRIREALSLAIPRAAGAELVDEVRLPPEARRALRRVAVAERRLELAHATAIAARCAGARVLTGPPVGLSVRDAAEVLGVSHQRVHQLKSSSASRAPGRRGGHASTNGAARG
jgi:predicted RNase H-like HicB family nuclease